MRGSLLWNNARVSVQTSREATLSKRAKIIAAIVTLVVVAGVAAFFVIGGQGAGPEVESAEVVEQELAVTVTASGKVDTGLSADVFPPAAATISEVYVSDGATVTAGEKIAQLDTAPLELQVAQAQAGLSQAEAQLAAIDAQATGPADLSAARAQVDAAYQSYIAAKASLDAISDQAPSQTQIDAAEAGVVAAENAYKNALAAYNAAVAVSPNPSTDATVAAAAAARDAAYAGYLNAEVAYEQVVSTDLAGARAQAQAGVDQAYAAYKGAQAQYIKLQNADSCAQRQAAEDGVQQAALALSLAEDNLDKATLTAPIDGVVVFNAGGAAALGAAGAQSALPGEGTAVTPGSAPFTVVDLDALKFNAEVDEADVDRVKVGQKVGVTLDAFPGDVFESVVRRVNPTAQPTATGGTVFFIEIELIETEADILLGMKGDAEIEVSSVGAALTIPVEALFSEGGTDFVYLIDNSVLKKTEITVGATTDTEVEVVEGLAAGDEVALSGSTQYTDGMTVRVTSE